MSKIQTAYNEFIQSLGTATNSMNSAIKESIVKKDAVDTGRMMNVTFVKIDLDAKTMKPTGISIDSTFYYKFVDQGTKHITPREITVEFMKTSKFRKEITRVVAAWTKWQTVKEIYTSL
jgi:hypothetical protein